MSLSETAFDRLAARFESYAANALGKVDLDPGIGGPSADLAQVERALAFMDVAFRLRTLVGAVRDRDLDSVDDSAAMQRERGKGSV